MVIPASEPVPEDPLTAPSDATPTVQRPAAPRTNIQKPTTQAPKKTGPVPARPQHKPPPEAVQSRNISSSLLTPVAAGTLTVFVRPWGEIWIDGQKRGFSPPRFQLQLPPGRYRVELRNPGQPTHVQQLQIPSGQSVTLRHDFL